MRILIASLLSAFTLCLAHAEPSNDWAPGETETDGVSSDQQKATGAKCSLCPDDATAGALERGAANAQATKKRVESLAGKGKETVLPAGSAKEAK